MRVIPKNTNITSTIYKSFTLWDFFIAGGVVGLLALIGFSNLPGKLYFILGAFVLCAPLFFPLEGGGRFYQNIGAMISFRFMKKSYKGKEIERFVPYKEIRASGTIVYPEYFSKVIEVGSTEFRLLDENLQDQKISFFEKVLKLVDIGSALDIVKIDRPINFDGFSQYLFERVAEEKNNTKKVILEDRLAQIDRLNNLDKQYRPYYYLVFYDNKEKSLEENVSTAVTYLRQLGLDSFELSQKETVNFLKYCHTRFFDEREIDNVDPQNYISYIAPKDLKFAGKNYVVDGINAFTMAISDYPLAVANAWGSNIFNIDNTKVVLKIRPVERSKAVKRIDKVVQELGSREDQIQKASQVIENESHIGTMSATLQSLQNENEVLFDCTLTITAFNNNKEDAAAFRKSIRHRITTDGFKLTPLSSMQVNGFLASNISQVRSLKRFERGINSSSLAAVFPFVDTSIIDVPRGIIFGCNNYPVALDITKRDGNHTNSNCLILGKPGSGKTYAVKSIVTQLYADNWRVHVLDVENEFSTLARNVGGTIIDVGSATQGRINPFHIYGLLTDDGEKAAPSVVFDAHLIALESFFRIILDGISSDTMEFINNLIVDCYARKGITKDTDCTDFPASRFPTFDDLMAVLKAVNRENLNPLTLQNLQRAETYIAKFATGGRYASLWNGASTLTTSSQFTVFNFQSLLSNKNTVVANAQMLLVMRFLEQEVINARDKNKSGDKLIRTAIVAEEAHAFTDPKFPVALDFLFQMAKRIRKYAGALFFITQNLRDGRSTPDVAAKTTAIFNCCQYSFIFSLSPQDIIDLVELYKASGGINEVEQLEIVTNQQGTAFLISSASERTSFTIVTTPVVESMFIRADERQL